MRISLLSLVLIYSLSTPVFSGGSGAPNIQAICKVTLVNGETVEGMVFLGHGAYYGKYRPSGFCVMTNNRVQDLTLFDLPFYFEPEKNTSYVRGKSIIYYAQNLTQSKSQKIYFDFDSVECLLTRSENNEQFKLIDEFVLYKKLPLSMYVEAEQNDDEKIFVKTNQIKKVQFLQFPDQKWIDLIDNARRKLSQQIREDEAEDENAWIDYEMPEWYHDIMKDPAKVERLKGFF